MMDPRERVRRDEQFRNELCDWVRANDLDPADIPDGSTITVADGQITTTVFVRNADGKLQVDPLDPHSVIKHTITVPLKVEPNAAAREYLSPRCPTCGR